MFFFFKQKTAYEIGTGDWSSDVCSSDLDDDDGGFLELDTNFLYLAVSVLILSSTRADNLIEIGRASCRERV